MLARWMTNIALAPFLIIAILCACLVAIGVSSYDELLARKRRLRRC